MRIFVMYRYDLHFHVIQFKMQTKTDENKKKVATINDWNNTAIAYCCKQIEKYKKELF